MSCVGQNQSTDSHERHVSGPWTEISILAGKQPDIDEEFPPDEYGNPAYTFYAYFFKIPAANLEHRLYESIPRAQWTLKWVGHHGAHVWQYMPLPASQASITLHVEQGWVWDRTSAEEFGRLDQRKLSCIQIDVVPNLVGP
jgi:hypothetical protein